MAKKIEKDSSTKWISSDLKPPRLWLERIGKFLGFSLHHSKKDEEFGYLMVCPRWWYSLESCAATKVSFPGPRADFLSHAFDSPKGLLAAVLTTKTPLVYHKSSSAFFFDNSTLAGTRSKEELELKLALLGK